MNNKKYYCVFQEKLEGDTQTLSEFKTLDEAKEEYSNLIENKIIGFDGEILTKENLHIDLWNGDFPEKSIL